MAHPYAAHRQGKLEHERVARIAGGAPSVAMKNENALGALKRGEQSAKVDRITTAASGSGATKRLDKFARSGKVKHRGTGGSVDWESAADLRARKEDIRETRPKDNVDNVAPRSLARKKDQPDQYARGGKVKSKGTSVNIIIGAQDKPPMPTAGAAPLPLPPMPPGPMAGAPPGLPGAGPMPMPPRSMGGRAAFAKGGAVKDKGLGSVKAEGMRNGTQVDHRPGKSDLGDIRTKPPITYARGGAVPKWLDGGAGSGVGRLEKAEEYGKRK
jgi:hypothetical protein